MHNLNDDMVSLMRKRVYDMAGLLPNVKVFLNEKQLEINSFLKYVDMYFTNAEEAVKIRDQAIDN
jgi:DNA topoisomerase-2